MYRLFAKHLTKKKVQKIEKDTPLSEIAEEHPEVADFLVNEYGFHCTNCFLSEFESLEQGAFTHGFEEEDVDKLLDEVNEMIR